VKLGLRVATLVNKKSEIGIDDQYLNQLIASSVCQSSRLFISFSRATLLSFL
jgi:hypothetical protein